jgi:hypothetical protein
MRQLTLVVRCVTALIVPAMLLGCRRDTNAPDAVALTNEPFFITGSITQTGHPWGYLVRGEPGTSYRVNEVFFTVNANTVIRRADGGPATPADLTVGRAISLWITGAIAESLPPQVGARLIVLK